MSGIIVAGIVSQIKGESLDPSYTGMKVDVPSVLLSIKSDYQLWTILEMLMTHTFSLSDFASSTDDADSLVRKEKKEVEQRQLMLLCEILYTVIMWHIMIIYHQQDKASGSSGNFGSGSTTRRWEDTENAHPDNPSYGLDIQLAVLIHTYPFLCVQ